MLCGTESHALLSTLHALALCCLFGGVSNNGNTVTPRSAVPRAASWSVAVISTTSSGLGAATSPACTSMKQRYDCFFFVYFPYLCCCCWWWWWWWRSWWVKVNNYTFARYLKEEAGYKVGMFGKYLNTFPQNGYVPPGFDAWLANGGGNYIAPGTYE